MQKLTAALLKVDTLLELKMFIKIQLGVNWAHTLTYMACHKKLNRDSIMWLVLVTIINNIYLPQTIFLLLRSSNTIPNIFSEFMISNSLSSKFTNVFYSVVVCMCKLVYINHLIKLL